MFALAQVSRWNADMVSEPIFLVRLALHEIRAFPPSAVALENIRYLLVRLPINAFRVLESEVARAGI